MQKDFHFEATYYAARIAGFDIDEAYKIGWAAQYIDDATDVSTKTVQLPGKKTYAFTNILTANTIPGGVGLTMRDDKHRQIWALYHFLPGNYRSYGKRARPEHILRTFRGVKVPEAGEAFSAKTVDNEAALTTLQEDQLTREHFPMITRPYSDLVLAMMEDTTATYAALAKESANLALHFLGIRMHVFADTWAHQDHIGSPDRRMNRVESFKWYRGKGKWNDDLTFTPGGKLETDNPGGSQGLATHKRNNNAWLGHGPMGSWPDMPWAVYEWQPRYNKDQTPFLRNNPEQYLQAFTNLVHAMKCVRAGDVWTPKYTATHIRGVLSTSDLDKFKRAILRMQGLTTKTKNKENRLIDEQRAEVWKDVFEDYGKPVYNAGMADGFLKLLEKEKKYPAESFIHSTYFSFHHGAKVHYRFMRNELRSQGLRVIFNNIAREEGMIDDLEVIRLAVLDAKVHDEPMIHAHAMVWEALADCYRVTTKADVQLGVQLFSQDVLTPKNVLGIIQAIEAVIRTEEKGESEYKLYTQKKIKKRVLKLYEDLKKYLKAALKSGPMSTE